MFEKIKGFINSPKYGKTFKLIFILAVVAAIPLTVLIAQQQQETRQRASGPITPPYPPSNIVLKFSPDNGTYKVGDTFDVSLLVESGSEKITGVNLTLFYNSRYADLISFTKSTESDFLNSTLISPVTSGNLGIGATAGLIRLAVVNTQGSQNTTNYFSLGTFSFKAKAVGTETITFTEHDKQQITSLGQPNALSFSTTPATYNIVNEFTPTPIPTSITPTGIGVSTPTPTIIIVSPTKTPTPTSAKITGDVNGDGEIDVLDYTIWQDEFTGVYQTKRSDLNNDGKIDLLDFNIWRNAFDPTTPTPIVSSKMVFVTSNTSNADLKSAGSKYGLGTATDGLDGADKICQGSANAAKLGGTWKAWLSDSTGTATSRLNHNNGPYKLVNGNIIANSWNDLIDGTLAKPINITESGENLLGGNAWSNTSALTGGLLGGYSCDRWTSTNSNGIGLTGAVSMTDSSWSYTAGSMVSCDKTFVRLYCFQQ